MAAVARGSLAPGDEVLIPDPGGLPLPPRRGARRRHGGCGAIAAKHAGGRVHRGDAAARHPAHPHAVAVQPGQSPGDGASARLARRRRPVSHRARLAHPVRRGLVRHRVRAAPARVPGLAVGRDRPPRGHRLRLFEGPCACRPAGGLRDLHRPSVAAPHRRSLWRGADRVRRLDPVAAGRRGRTAGRRPVAAGLPAAPADPTRAGRAAPAWPLVPGSPRWFGAGASRHVRLCFATSRGILTTALDRIEGWLQAPR